MFRSGLLLPAKAADALNRLLVSRIHPPPVLDLKILRYFALPIPELVDNDVSTSGYLADSD